MEEVFERQPQHVQQFLLETSILQRINGSLCTAVTGQENGQFMLRMLTKANLFIIPVDAERVWYRYDPLFARFLQTRLGQQGAEQLSRLHSKAYTWYEQHETYVEAVEHAFAAGHVK